MRCANHPAKPASGLPGSLRACRSAPPDPVLGAGAPARRRPAIAPPQLSRPWLFVSSTNFSKEQAYEAVWKGPSAFSLAAPAGICHILGRLPPLLRPAVLLDWSPPSSTRPGAATTPGSPAAARHALRNRIWHDCYRSCTSARCPDQCTDLPRSAASEGLTRALRDCRRSGDPHSDSSFTWSWTHYARPGK